jgi:hypothetical protein
VDRPLRRADVLTAAERRGLAAASQREQELLARITATATRLTTLYRTRQTGAGPDASWSAQVAAHQETLDRLYAALRAARARGRDIQWEADRRLQKARQVPHRHKVGRTR